MARPLRIEYPGAWYHVTSRGNEKAEIFRDDSDRRTFLKILKESLEIFQVELHCFVLMLNHFHLIIKTPLANLSRFMQRLNTAYTVLFNSRHNRAGHLFQGRYKAILVDADSYLLELSRYVHLNPLRTEEFRDVTLREKMRFLDNYMWSSFRSYGGYRLYEDFIQTSFILGMVSRDKKRAIRAYRRFVFDGLLRGIRDPLKLKQGQIILGSKSFTQIVFKAYIENKQGQKEYTRIKESLPDVTMDQIATSVAYEFHLNPEDIVKRRSKHQLARKMLIELCCRFLVKALSLSQIARALGGVSVSSLGRNRRVLTTIMQNETKVIERFDKIKEEILSS